MPQLSSYSHSRAPRSLPFRILSQSDHFLPKATLTQGTIIKCASISLTSLQFLISSSPVPEPLPGLFPLYPVFRSNPHEGDARPRPQSDFQSLQKCDFLLSPNIPKYSSRGLTASLRQSLRSSSTQASSLASRALCCLRTALVSSFIGETGLSGPVE